MALLSAIAQVPPTLPQLLLVDWGGEDLGSIVVLVLIVGAGIALVYHKRWKLLCLYVVLVTGLLSAGAWWVRTPVGRYQQLRSNTADAAEHAASGRDLGLELHEALDWYSADHPYWGLPENRLARKYYLHAVRTAFENPDITPTTVKRMHLDFMSAHRRGIVEAFRKASK